MPVLYRFRLTAVCFFFCTCSALLLWQKSTIFPLREPQKEWHRFVESLPVEEKIRKSYNILLRVKKKTLHFLTGLYFPQILRSADLVGCVCRTLFPFYAFCFSNPVVAAAAAGHSRCSPLVGFRLPMTSFHFLFDNVSVISLSNSLAFACCRMCLTTTLFIYTSFVFLYTVTGVFVIFWSPVSYSP